MLTPTPLTDRRRARSCGRGPVPWNSRIGPRRKVHPVRRRGRQRVLACRPRDPDDRGPPPRPATPHHRSRFHPLGYPDQPAPPRLRPSRRASLRPIAPRPSPGGTERGSRRSSERSCSWLNGRPAEPPNEYDPLGVMRSLLRVMGVREPGYWGG